MRCINPVVQGVAISFLMEGTASLHVGERWPLPKRMRNGVWRAVVP